MRKSAGLALLIILCASAAGAFDVYSYWEPPFFGAGGSAAVADDATSVPLNPAGLAAGHGFNGYFSRYVQELGPENFHGYLDTLLGGFGYDWTYARDENIRASRFSWTFGGTAYRWIGVGMGLNRLAASKPYLTSAWSVDAGLLLRPHPLFSFGATARNLNEPRFLRRVEGRTYVAAVGVRPGWQRLTLSCDVGWRERDPLDEMSFRGGVDVEIFDGVTVGAEVDDERNFGVGLSVGFAYGGLAYNTRLDEGGEYISDNASARFNVERRPSVFTPRDHYAEVEVAGDLVETEPGFSLLGGRGMSGRDLVRRLKLARDNRNIKGVLIRVRDVDTGFGPGISALTQEVREEIKKVRGAGKTVYAYIEDVNRPAGYYIASAADVVAMPPGGYFGGVGTYMTMWRVTKLTERYGIEWDYLTAGDYKGAFHIIGDEPTPAMEDEVREIVDGTYRQFLRDVASDRGLTAERLRELCEGPPLTAAACRDAGLCDEVARYEDFKEMIARADGGEELPTTSVSLRRPWRREWGKPKSVRVIIAEGSIVSGKSGRSFITGSRTIGEDTVVGQLRKAREDADVGAIVLRVDSGGGEALASENIFQEVVKCRESGKPVVASMSDVAASGGYFIACGAEYVYAEPATLTGSIGVAFAKPALEEFYRKYGIERVPVKSHEHVDALTYHRHLTEEEEAWVAGMTQDVYRRFMAIVAEARGMELSRLEELAGGRVYTGARAKELGLIDELGGLEDAVDYARSKGNLAKDAPVEYVVGGAGFWERAPAAAATLLGVY
ncbi:MAG: signal peptide peptidase SppA [bacterium]